MSGRQKTTAESWRNELGWPSEKEIAVRLLVRRRASIFIPLLFISVVSQTETFFYFLVLSVVRLFIPACRTKYAHWQRHFDLAFFFLFKLGYPLRAKAISRVTRFPWRWYFSFVLPFFFRMRKLKYFPTCRARTLAWRMRWGFSLSLSLSLAHDGL